MAQVIMLGAHVGVLKSTLVLLAVFLAHGVEFRALGSIHQHHRAAVEREVEEDVAPAAGADAGYGEPQGGSAPQRFLIYSFRHSGTHFLRDALMSGRNVSIGDEVFMTMQHMEQVLNLTVTQPDQRVPEVIEPVLGLFWGILPDSINASSRLNSRIAHYVCDARYRFDPANPCGANGTDAKGHAQWDVTWGQLRDNLLRKRAVGALWNHNTIMEGQPSAGIFADAHFVRYLKRLGARVVLYERINGLAEYISKSNTKRTDNEHNGAPQPVHLELARLSHFNEGWQRRDANYRSAFGVLQREHVPAVYVTYEQLMAQPDDLTRLYRFIGKEAPAPGVADKSQGRKWHTAPTSTYVSNADEVRAWIRDGKLPGMSECMLEDDCATASPEYSENVP